MDKKKKYFWGAIIGIAIISIPLILGWIIPRESFIENFTDSNDWIGFWGSYTGSIIGGLITLFVMKRSTEAGNENLERNIEENKKIQEENEKNIFGMEITNLIGDYCSDISAYYYASKMSINYHKKRKELYDNFMSGEISESKYYNQLSILEIDRQRVDRRKSTAIYFKLEIMLKYKKEADLLFETLTNIHSNYCYPTESSNYDYNKFEDMTKKLRDEAAEFIKIYTK